jgi:hypothetical protein
VRLFNVSTLRAARAGLVEGMMSQEMQAEVGKAETAICARVPIGNRVSTRQLLTELTARLVRVFGVPSPTVTLANKTNRRISRIWLHDERSMCWFAAK